MILKHNHTNVAYHKKTFTVNSTSMFRSYGRSYCVAMKSLVAMKPNFSGRNVCETSVLYVFRGRNFRKLVPNSRKFLLSKNSFAKIF